MNRVASINLGMDEMKPLDSVEISAIFAGFWMYNNRIVR